MPVGNISPPEVIYQIAGVEIGITAAGVRYKNRDDLVVFRINESAQTVVVTTQNVCCAAPVTLVRRHIQHLISGNLTPQYLIINTGNANAATGTDGHERAKLVCESLAKEAGVKVEQVLPYSTGVIGETLNSDAIIQHLDNCLTDLNGNQWLEAANAIRTTDTIPKVASEKVTIDAESSHNANARHTEDETTYHITGISKGAGMIRPNMATMLGYVATDARIERTLLQKMLVNLTKASFNRITVDGDTSTNDCCTLIATGKASNTLIDSEEHPHYQPLYRSLLSVFKRLATLIVRDGEGATKFITVKVTGGATVEDCCDVAYAVAHSPLVKTAFFASDPNWGRILAAVGYSGVHDLKSEAISISLDDLPICTRGQLDSSYKEEAGQAVMSRPEITIHIDLGSGQASDTVYTCDLSDEYIRINADYRS